MQSDIVERLREAANDEDVFAAEQDFWHAELLREAADEIERLYSLAKANNELARRNRQEADAMRSQSITNARERNAAIDEIERLRALTSTEKEG